MPQIKGKGASLPAATKGKTVDKASAKEAAAAAKAKEAKEKELAKAKEAKAKAATKAKEEKDKAKAAKAQETAKKKEEAKAAKAAKAAAKVKEPEWVEQMDEKGETELVDKNKFPYEVACSVCGSIRYVSKSGLLLVDKCKLHAKKERRARRMKKIRQKGQAYRSIVKAALEQNLFPPAFMKKFGLN